MIAAMITLGGIAFILALGLGVASRIFAVKIDPRVEAIGQLLPGANCGGCGYAGCSGFAEALVAGQANPSDCQASKSEAIQEIARVLGVEVVLKEKQVAKVFCAGGNSQCRERYHYQGIEDCRAAMLLSGGQRACPFACLGFGSCARACPFGAIEMEADGLPYIDESRCTGCGSCFRQCPKGVLYLVPSTWKGYIPCSSKYKGKEVRLVCQVGCLSCGLCVKKCPQQAISLVNDHPVIDHTKCDGCGICAEKCPQKIITLAHKNMDRLAAV